MNNRVTLIGRIFNDIEKSKNGENTTYKLTLQINQNFKNEDGEYGVDLIPVVISENIGNTLFNHCLKGDIVGIKGRLAYKENNALEVVTEKITLLTSRKAD